MAAMCSTWQAPRARKAFSSACAARTWPAPEDAESSRTRGLRLMPWEAGRGILGIVNKKQLPRFARNGKYRKKQSSGFPGARGQFFQDAASDFLRFAEAGKVILELAIDGFGVLDAELVAQDHVAKLDGMREQGVFLQLFQSGCGVVVIHRSVLQKAVVTIVLICGAGRNAAGKGKRSWAVGCRGW